MMPKTVKTKWKYRGWVIERNPSPLGDMYSTHPGENTGMRAGTWSLADAKRMIDNDIKQAACTHPKWERMKAQPHRASSIFEECAKCGKRRSVKKSVEAN